MPKTLGRYVLRERIGRGGMGEVYRALDPKLPRRRVAIKTLTSLAPPDRERFKREAEAISMASMSSRHVVKIFEFGEDEEGAPYIVMELLHGEDLGSVLRSGPLEISRAVDIVLGICSGAWACHRRGILHRDIKPKNVVLHMEDEGEVVKILDFGVSVYPFSSEITGPYQVMGTPRYMSPEQLEGRTVDERSDIYSIGVVLYECITGRLPFEGPDDPSRISKILSGRFPPPVELRPEVPPELDRIVRRAISRDPDDRFPTARDLGQSLIPFANEAKRILFTENFLAPVRPMVERMTSASSHGSAAVAPTEKSQGSSTLKDEPTAASQASTKPPSGVIPLAPLVERRGPSGEVERTQPEDERSTVRYDAAPTVVVSPDRPDGEPPARGAEENISPASKGARPVERAARAAEEGARYQAGGTRRLPPAATRPASLAADSEGASREQAASPAKPSRTRLTLLVAVGLGLVGTGVIMWLSLGRSDSSEPSQATPVFVTDVRTRVIVVDAGAVPDVQAAAPDAGHGVRDRSTPDSGRRRRRAPVGQPGEADAGAPILP